MAVKIRLQRHGKKNFAFFHIVVADSRSPRDGRYIEQIGSYNPNTNPATIVLNFERALAWIKVGNHDLYFTSSFCRLVRINHPKLYHL